MLHQQPLWQVIAGGCFMAIMLIVLIQIAAQMFKTLYGNDARTVRPGYIIITLIGAWLMIAGIFGQFYTIIFYFDRASFSFGDVPEFGSSLMSASYFSITTLTSTGYGDIHPKGELAMAAASVEMLIGYLMTVVFFSAVAGLAFRSRR